MHDIAVLLCCLLLCSGVRSFDPGWSANFLQSEDTSHYTITECALLQVASDYLKSVYKITSVQSVINIENGQCRTKPIYNAMNSVLDGLKLDRKRLSTAIETIAEANTKMDLSEASREATHFDNEQFDEGALLISRRLTAASSSATMGKYDIARESFGALLHTVQDFYSHSNWIEIGHREPNKGIGKYEILGKYASAGMRTCVDCTGDECRVNIHSSVIENNILTSGYFGLQVLGVNVGSVSKPIGKCSHGGSFDHTVQTDAKGGGINKDTLKSDHGHLHRIAASVAYNATKQILTEFWSMIGEEPFGQFLGLSTNLQNLSANSLIIVMDDTGSMSPYIQMAKQIAISIVEIHQTLEYKPSNYILSPFNDPTWGPLTISKTPEQFTIEINNLTAHDGGDTPELYYHGIVEALKVCETGSYLYAFTDAPAKDAYLKSQAVQLAKEKRVTVTLFYAKFDYRKIQGGRMFARMDDVIEDLDTDNGTSLTSLTGGVTMGVNPQAANATRDYIVQRLEADKLVTVVFVEGTNMTVRFYIDTSIKSLNIEVTARNYLSSTGFSLVKPSGETVALTPTSQTPFILIYAVEIAKNETGNWTMISNMNTGHTVQINAMSAISCSSTLQKEIIGSSSNISFTPLTTQPVKQETGVLVLTICDNLPSNLTTGRVDLIDSKDGSKVLATMYPIDISSTGFLSRIEIPDAAFRLSIVAKLKDGTVIQRQDKQLISPTFISLTVNNQPYIVFLNSALAINYTIYNHGQNELNITLRATDTLGLLSTSGSIKNYTLPTLSNATDTIAMSTVNFTGIDSNSTGATDSIILSITTVNYEYDETVPLYILRQDISLTNQSDYQQPPKPITGAVNMLQQSTMLFALNMLLLAFYQ